MVYSLSRYTLETCACTNPQNIRKSSHMTKSTAHWCMPIDTCILWMKIDTCIHADWYMHTCRWIHAYMPIDTCIHADGYMHTCRLIHAYMPIDTCIHADGWYMHTCRWIHAYMPIDTCIHAYRSCKYSAWILRLQGRRTRAKYRQRIPAILYMCTVFQLRQ